MASGRLDVACGSVNHHASSQALYMTRRCCSRMLWYCASGTALLARGCYALGHREAPPLLYKPPNRRYTLIAGVRGKLGPCNLVGCITIFFAHPVFFLVSYTSRQTREHVQEINHKNLSCRCLAKGRRIFLQNFRTEGGQPLSGTLHTTPHTIPTVYGVMWCGVLGFVVVWFGMVWCGVVWCGAQYGVCVVLCGVLLVCVVVSCGGQYGAVWYMIVHMAHQTCTVRHITPHTAQKSAWAKDISWKHCSFFDKHPNNFLENIHVQRKFAQCCVSLAQACRCNAVILVVIEPIAVG